MRIRCNERKQAQQENSPFHWIVEHIRQMMDLLQLEKQLYSFLHRLFPWLFIFVILFLFSLHQSKIIVVLFATKFSHRIRFWVNFFFLNSKKYPPNASKFSHEKVLNKKRKQRYFTCPFVPSALFHPLPPESTSFGDPQTWMNQ